MTIKGALWKKIWKREDSISASLEKNAIKTIALKAEKCGHCGYPMQKYVPEYSKINMDGKMIYSEGKLVFYSIREFTMEIPIEGISLEPLGKFLVQTVGNGVALNYDELPDLLAGMVIKDKRFEIIIPYASAEGNKSSTFVFTSVESANQLGSWLRNLFKANPVAPTRLVVQDHGGDEVKPNALMPKA